MRIIGDVHGKIPDYLGLISEVENSVQLGDLGFNYNFLQYVDPTKHKVIKGNHDNYDWDSPHFLGDGGAAELGGVKFFFIRGERSIDWMFRTQGIDFWDREELSGAEMLEIEKLYLKERPSLVISHGCPAEVIDSVAQFKMYNGEVLRPSRTAYFLQDLLDQWRPTDWIFGHYHTSRQDYRDGTRFTCLDELETLDLCG